ncbi:MAG: PP2C family protein-serine/threonine phosphatase [Bdellovibrionales bacterium]|nr:PP2C family protein-serine/threonine phosphatase [Bdellovibrionales bacterium]
MANEFVLLIGNWDEKLPKFFSKMGYETCVESGETALPSILDKKHYDLIVLNSEVKDDLVHQIDFLRTDSRSQETPLVVITSSQDSIKEINSRNYTRISIVPEDFKLGALVSMIATELRLRKFDGKDIETASLADANLALRELTTHFQKELEDARKIQEALLPKKLPSSDKFEVSAYYQPLEEVGGDWYYVDEFEGKLRVIIADVTGHGLSAAFIGSMTKLAFTASKCAMPHDILREMNALIAPVMPDGSFITAFAATFDPETNILHYSRAGHPPAMLVNMQEGEVHQLKGDGFALGFFDESEYEALNIQMNSGDLFVCYTDALPESQNRDGKLYEYDRMSMVLKTSDSNRSSKEIIQAIIDDFYDFCDERLLKDDVTIVSLKCS